MSLTILLIGICALFSLLGWLSPGSARVFGLNPYAVFNLGEWYRILTHAFFHVDIWHLLINSYVFYNFGHYLEPFLGKKSYAILLLIGLLGSALLSMLMRSPYNQTVSIGFSGVVSAVVFCMITFYPQMKLVVFFIPMPAWLFAILYVIYSLIAGGREADGIDHWGHLGGAAAGVAYALL